MHTVRTVEDFFRLYNTYFPKIYNYVFRGVWRTEIAEDITSIVFEKALTFIKTHKKTVINNFQAWIYKIATNELLMYHKNRRKKGTLSLDEAGFSFENLLKDDRYDRKRYEDFMEIKAALMKLKPEEALLVELHFFEEKGYADLEAILGEKQSTIRSRIHRTLKKLKKLLHEELP